MTRPQKFSCSVHQRYLPRKTWISSSFSLPKRSIASILTNTGCARAHHPWPCHSRTTTSTTCPPKLWRRWRTNDKGSKAILGKILAGRQNFDREYARLAGFCDERRFDTLAGGAPRGEPCSGVSGCGRRFPSVFTVLFNRCESDDNFAEQCGVTADQPGDFIYSGDRRNRYRGR